MRQQALPRPAQTVRNVIGMGFDILLDRGRRGANLRMALVLGSFALAWTLLTLGNLQNVTASTWLTALPFPLGPAIDLGGAFFAPGVLIHMVPLAAGLWLGNRIAAHYLSDLLELEQFSVAAHYLRASLIGIGYDVLRVDTGELGSLDLKHPLISIGGPGYLQVNLGFAAVVEDIDGIPRVIGPSASTFIHGFERLRDAVDLRDQLRNVDEVRAVTRDGIEIRAREVQMVFRVFSGGKPRSLADPYPYSEEAVRRLAYGQAVTEEGPRKWTENLKDLVSREIMAFVSDLTIEEFMALQPTRELILGERGGSMQIDRAASTTRPLHIPRRQLTERFHTPEARRRLQDEGLELAWVGVGTWEVGYRGGADEPETLGETLIGAWLDLQRARQAHSPEPMEDKGIQIEGEVARALFSKMLDEWQGIEAAGSGCQRMLTVLHESLRDLFVQRLSGQGDAPPAGVRAALDHLAQLARAQEAGGGA